MLMWSVVTVASLESSGTLGTGSVVGFQFAGFIESLSQGWLGGMMLGKLLSCVVVTYANIVHLQNR